MYAYLKTWLELKADRRAVTTIEYAVLAGGIIAAIVGVVSGMGTTLSTKINAIVNSIAS
jgi:Flp pilus assembly pilin Flp